jgi:hypothetical protein
MRITDNEWDALVEGINAAYRRQEASIERMEELLRQYRKLILKHTGEETLLAIDQDIANRSFARQAEEKEVV